MPPWTTTETWKGEDVCIIGGGPSLEDFDWSLLEDENTIGCNMAFKLGEKVCKLCIFGDARWFDVFEKELVQYKGIVFTNVPSLSKSRKSWLWTMPREMRGLHKTALGWNGNTGASAINLALILGVKTIFLLGFDMCLSDEGKPNWHDRIIQKPNKSAYPKFVEQYGRVAVDLEKKFPGRKVINVTKDSNLEVFPKIDADEFWKERRSA